jgi:hypothetical protein
MPSKDNNAYYKRKYGITLEDYNRMFEEQGGRCAICGTHQCATGRALAVDHDHKTGKVRGLLCQACNTAIGKLNDDPELIHKAADYVATHATGLQSVSAGSVAPT